MEEHEMTEWINCPVPGWDKKAQDHFDALSDEGAADLLDKFAEEVVRVGNVRSHLHAAARRIRRSKQDHLVGVVPMDTPGVLNIREALERCSMLDGVSPDDDGQGFVCDYGGYMYHIQINRVQSGEKEVA